MYDFRNKVVVVTGGASGMGRSFVMHILAKGGLVSFGDINVPLSKSILMHVHTTAPRLVSRLLFTQTDIRDPASVRDLFDRTKQVFGLVDITLCVAGVNVPDSFLPCGSRPDSANLLNIQVNLIGSVNTVHAGLPHLAQDGTIVVIASTAGLYPSSVQPMYAASKHGLIGFARSIAPLMPYQQRMITLAPSTYLPPHAFKDGVRVTPEVEGDVFTKVIGETIGFIQIPTIIRILDETLERATNGSVIELTPSKIGEADFPPIPQEFVEMDIKLRRQLCTGQDELQVKEEALGE